MDYEKLQDKVSKAFDNYELFFLEEKTKKYETKDTELFGVEIKEEEGIALRAIKDNRMVFSYTFDRGDEAIDALVENGAALLPYMERDESVGFPGQQKDYPMLNIYDNEGLKVDDTVKTAMVVEMEKTVFDYDKRIVTTRNCEFQELEIQTRIINSNGVQAEGKKTLFTFFALAVASDKDEVSWYDWIWAHRLEELDARALGRDVARKTISFLSGNQIDTGIYEGILAPQAACDILGVLSGSFLSENLYKNKTKLKDKTGTRCFSDAINVKDSGLQGMGAFPFDGEGRSSQENSLVASGYFNTFLYDTYYGRKLNMSSTGNSVRSGVKEPPKCAPRGFFIEKGTRDIGKEITDGIIIEELMGTHTANEVTGDFSLGAIGYLCKAGNRTPFKGVIFSGNIFELLNSVKEVGNDLKFYGAYGSPSLYIEGLKISGR